MQGNTLAPDATIPIQKIYSMKLVKHDSEYHLKEQVRGELVPVEDTEGVRPGATFYIRPNNYTNQFYETVFSPLQTIDMIQEFVHLKRIWKRK